MIGKKLAIVGGVVAVLGLVGVPAGAQNDVEPAATDVGISADEIRIAIVADVDSPISPGVFQGQVDAVRAYAKYVNGRGGIAGRKLVVDFFDSKLNPNETRNAIIEACGDDFAMVGTSAVFMNNVDDMVACTDSAGKATGLPDIPTLMQERAHQCSPVSYSISPPNLDCATQNEPVKTYRASFGHIRYYLKKHKDLHGICVGVNSLKSIETTGRVHCGSVEKLGVELDGDGFYGVAGLAPQATLTPVVSAAKGNGATYVNTLVSYAQAISLRKEAKLQGLDTVKVWDCSRSCYDDKFLAAGGADVEEHYAFLNTLPLDEGKHNKELARYLKAVGPDNADAFGATAWTAAVLLHETIDKIVERDGVNGLTRATFLEELARVHEFDANGMLATTDVAARRASDCYFLSQVQDGKFVRVHPQRPGTFDCSPKNVVTVRVSDS